MGKAKTYFFSYYRSSVQESNLIPLEYKVAVFNHSATIISAKLIWLLLITYVKLYIVSVSYIFVAVAEKALHYIWCRIQPNEMPTTSQCAVRLCKLLSFRSRNVSFPLIIRVKREWIRDQIIEMVEVFKRSNAVCISSPVLHFVVAWDGTFRVWTEEEALTFRKWWMLFRFSIFFISEVDSEM
jgi:hypothetical protein